MIIPKHIEIETINGVCTARCIMCTINKWQRTPRVMTNDEFKIILTKLLDYKHKLEYLTLHGCGEPLLDRELPQKIKIAKEMGYKGIGFASNCTNLDRETSEKLIRAGLDTIICSIDGISRETHEGIRVGTDFYKVVENVKNFITLRNQLGEKLKVGTRVVIRFIRMDSNKGEWSQFKRDWENLINRAYDDDIIKFDVHNWGEDIENYSDLDINRELKVEKIICQDVFERLYIYSNGNVSLCCADDNGYYEMGNAFECDPIEIYNNDIFTKHRKLMQEGKISELEYCNKCTIPRSRYKKQIED